MYLFLLLIFSNYSYYVGRMGLNFVSYIQMIYPFNKFIIKNDDFAYFRRGLDQNFNGVDIAGSPLPRTQKYQKITRTPYKPTTNWCWNYTFEAWWISGDAIGSTWSHFNRVIRVKWVKICGMSIYILIRVFETSFYTYLIKASYTYSNNIWWPLITRKSKKYNVQSCYYSDLTFEKLWIWYLLLGFKLFFRTVVLVICMWDFWQHLYCYIVVSLLCITYSFFCERVLQISYYEKMCCLLSIIIR